MQKYIFFLLPLGQYWTKEIIWSKKYKIWLQSHWILLEWLKIFKKKKKKRGKIWHIFCLNYYFQKFIKKNTWDRFFSIFFIKQIIVIRFWYLNMAKIRSRENNYIFTFIKKMIFRSVWIFLRYVMILLLLFS